MGDEVEHDGVARVVLFNMQKERELSFALFVKLMRAEYTKAFPLMICKELYAKYVGWPDAIMPTHDLKTGEPLR